MNASCGDFLESFIFPSLMQCPAKSLIIVADATWTRYPLPSKEYDSVWEARVYKLTKVRNKNIL